MGDVFEEELYQFIITNCKDELIQILKDPRDQIHYPVVVGLVDLNYYGCGTSTNQLLRYPDKVLKSGDRAAYRAQLFIHHEYNGDDKDELKVKQKIHFRVNQIPEDGIDRYMTTFPGTIEAGTFMAIVGTVGKMCKSGPKEFQRDYWCNRCKNIITLTAARSRYYMFPETLDHCENHCAKAKVVACKLGVDGLTTKDAHRFKDYQEIKIQERILNATTSSSNLQNTLWVVLEDDLVDSCKPGDDVVITGTLYTRFKPFRVNQPIEVDLAFMANHVEVTNDRWRSAATAIVDNEETFFNDFWKHYHAHNPFEGRNIILHSFCPQICRMYLVKMAMSVVLAGGVSKENNGSRVRGESHLLLVGDPGTAKSQFLKYACQMLPRSIFTTGAGTSSAGLTVAAVMENGTWTLEAGALVLGDCGVVCIDEFSNIKKQDRVSIHEAMEQQTVSVAKAGMVTKLSTRCTIMAATNPKISKKFDKIRQMDDDEMDVDDGDDEDEMNIDLSSPLLSRFDVVIYLKDEVNEHWDEDLCNFILGIPNNASADCKNAGSGDDWNPDRLQSYFMLIKGINPQMTEDAETILNKYYSQQRQSANRNVARTTVRLYESLFRLAEGHARLMFRKDVGIHDAITAICLAEMSMPSAEARLVPGFPNPLHVGFPKDAFREYYNQAGRLLQVLNLPELWEKEEKYLTNLRTTTDRSSPKPPSPSPKTSPPPKSPTPKPPSSSHFSLFENSNLSSNHDGDPSVIFETQQALSNLSASRGGNADNEIPENFFQVDEDMANVPCSLRIISKSTQGK